MVVCLPGVPSCSCSLSLCRSRAPTARCQLAWCTSKKAARGVADSLQTRGSCRPTLRPRAQQSGCGIRLERFQK